MLSIASSLIVLLVRLFESKTLSHVENRNSGYLFVASVAEDFR